MIDTALIGKLAGIVSFLGFIPYIWGILQGRVKPSIATWSIWTLIGASLFISYLKVSYQIDDSIWVPLSYVIGPFIISILCLWYGDRTYGRLDIFCFILSVSSLCLSYILNNFALSLFANILADFLGAFPTIQKSYKEPESEDITAWSIFFVGNGLNLMALNSLSQIEAVYPLYLFL
ncbi:MAG: hypothetical protein ACRYGR_04960 [Janthinobacterium lividum]